jgi:predicted Zn-dependent protease
VVGLDISAGAGDDPYAGVVLWKKMDMASKDAPTQWLSTHPVGADRIAEIHRHLTEVMPLYTHAKGLDKSAIVDYESQEAHVICL